MHKAQSASQVQLLTDIPNVGKSIAGDLSVLGISTPAQVALMDPFQVCYALRTPSGQRHDPCVLDVFMAAHEFMNGGEVKPWWHFTAQRKALLGAKG